VISNVIGVGIFTTPGVVAAMLPSSGQHDRERARTGMRRPRGDGGRRADLLVDGENEKK
jgi:hypothetical protein